MDRAQFLETLRNQLSGKMYVEKIEAHLRYYEDYIQSQVRGGRSEEEVLAELGDPRLIARTLLDTDPSSPDENGEEAYAYSDSRQERGYSGTGYGYEAQSPRKQRRLDLNTWYGKLIVIAIAVLVIFLLVTVLTAVLPFFVVFALVVFLISRFQKR